MTKKNKNFHILCSADGCNRTYHSDAGKSIYHP